MIRKILQAILFFVSLHTLCAQRYYLSNGLGSQLDELRTLSGDEIWYLAVSEDSGAEIRTLFHDGSQWKRWEILPLAEGGTQETYYFKSKLQEILQYDQQGKVRSEELFDNRGNILEHRSYQYLDNGVLDQILLLTEDGQTLKSSILLYRSDGSLREIQLGAGGPDPPERMIWRQDGTEDRTLDKTLLSDSNRSYIYSYEDWKLSSVKIFQEDKEVEKSLIAYDENGHIRKETLWNHLDNTMGVLLYDPSGMVYQENYYSGGILKRSISREYREGHLVSYLERNETDKIYWEYRYSDRSEDPVESTLYRNGSLVKKILLEEGIEKEILYKDNNPVFEKETPGSQEGDGF